MVSTICVLYIVDNFLRLQKTTTLIVSTICVLYIVDDVCFFSLQKLYNTHSTICVLYIVDDIFLRLQKLQHQT